MIEARGNQVWIELSASEVELLGSVPKWLAEVGVDPKDPAGPRLNQSAYPDDPMASAEFEVTHGATLDETRQEDRETFRTTLTGAVSGVALTDDQAAAWMRVIGDARLMFAARLGIEDNRWERRLSTDPEMRLVHYLTYLQSGLIEALDELMEDGD